MAKILALDYGEKRIGVAISDEEKKYAFGREVIENHGKNSSLEAIRKICQEEGVEKIILGLPWTLKGEESIQTLKTREFGKQLKRALGLPLELVDERLTSKLAWRLTREVKNTSRAKIDQSAALLILQDYLDSKINKK